MDTDPYYQIATITPEHAADLLKQNTSNRRVRARLVESLADDITSGRWVFDGNPIRIADDGTVLDGQHRLMACVRAESPIKAGIIRGLSHDSKRVMDTGASRTAADVLSLFDGVSNSKNVAAAARMSLTYRADALRCSSGIQKALSIPRLSEFVSDNPGLHDSVVWAASHKKALYPLTISTLGFIAFEAGDAEDDVRAFFEQVSSGEGLHPRSPELGLSRYLRGMSATNATRRPHRYAIGGAAVKTIWAYIDGREVLRVQTPSPGKSFPEIPSIPFDYEA